MILPLMCLLILSSHISFSYGHHEIGWRMYVWIYWWTSIYIYTLKLGNFYYDTIMIINMKLDCYTCVQVHEQQSPRSRILTPQSPKYRFLHDRCHPQVQILPSKQNTCGTWHHINICDNTSINKLHFKVSNYTLCCGWCCYIYLWEKVWIQSEGHLRIWPWPIVMYNTP